MKTMAINRRELLIRAAIGVLALLAVLAARPAAAQDAWQWEAVPDGFEPLAPATVFSPLTPNGRTVAYVDLNRYVGNWYEIATILIPGQDGCTGSTATYEALSPTRIAVLNECRLGKLDGPLYSVAGEARVVDTNTNARLRVAFDFFPLFAAPYWVIELDGRATDEPYEWAVVGGPTKGFLWILSRTPQMDEGRLAAILDRLIERGYDISKLSFTLQPEW